MKSTPLAPLVLLVDDNPDGSLVRKLVLEEAGFRVQCAASGNEALRLCAATRFDVIVTDFRMPGMNGDQLIQRLRALEPNSRIILLSGFVEPLGLTEANTGADAVISKNHREGSHLVRSVKRLVSMPPRKSPAVQTAAGMSAGEKSGTLKS